MNHIEAAARAMYEVRASRLPIVRKPRDSWDELHPGIRDLLREEATAALRAIPDGEMTAPVIRVLLGPAVRIYMREGGIDPRVVSDAREKLRALLGAIIENDSVPDMQRKPIRHALNCSGYYGNEPCDCGAV